MAGLPIKTVSLYFYDEDYNMTELHIPVAMRDKDSSVTYTDGVYCTGTKDLFTMGDNLNEAVDYSFNDGSILPLQPRHAGRQFSVDFVIFQRGMEENVNTFFHNLLDKLQNSIAISFSTTWYASDVMVDSIDLKDWDYQKGIISFTVNFTGSEA